MSTVTTPQRSTPPRAVTSAEQLRKGPGFAGGVSLVAEREIVTRLRSKSFLFSTVVILVLVVGGIVISALFSSSIGAAFGGSSEPVAVVAGSEDALEGSELETITVADRAEGEELLRAGDASAVIVPGGDSDLGITVIGLESAPSSVIEALSIVPAVEVIDPPNQDSLVAYFAAFGFGIVFFMAAILFGTAIAQSVVEEKATRVVEILMSTISVRALLAGKVIGNSIIALGQIVIIAAAAGIALALTGQGAILAVFGLPVIWFIVFFAIGFVLLSALFAATAALVSRQEDVNSAISPITTIVMIPYFLVILFRDNELVLAVMSYVPFSAPVGMPMRLLMGTAQWWEPLLSMAIAIGFTWVLIILAAKIYENSLLRTGSKIPLMQALRGA